MYILATYVHSPASACPAIFATRSHWPSAARTSAKAAHPGTAVGALGRAQTMPGTGVRIVEAQTDREAGPAFRPGSARQQCSSADGHDGRSLSWFGRGRSCRTAFGWRDRQTARLSRVLE
jgi:hypothetical protein